MMSVFHVEKKKYLHLRMLKEVCASFSFTGDTTSSLFLPLLLLHFFFQHPPYFCVNPGLEYFWLHLAQGFGFPTEFAFFGFYHTSVLLTLSLSHHG
jgi:hypothetical protein